MKAARNKKAVFVAMSGGVDSSVAALLLKRRGCDVTGIFMRCVNVDGCAEQDAEDARRAAEHIGIPFYVWDFEEEYKRRVVEYMVDGYRSGVTPNPDVMCNKEIKFGLFLRRALASGADFIATGHYARLRRHNANMRMSANAANTRKIIRGIRPSFVSFGLYVARDAQKDQSYFLWTLTQKQLAHCLFPIGDYLKSEVREIARGAGLPTAEKKDSQGICFLGKVTLADFLRQYIPSRRGHVLSTGGEPIGEHDGAEFYTIGQRHLGIRYQVSGVRRKGVYRDTKPHYVAEKDIRTNTVVVAEGDDNPALLKKEVPLTNVNVTRPLPFTICHLPVLARVRYRQPLAEAELRIENGETRLFFRAPVKFVASGQSAVFYNSKSEMLGGGIIAQEA